MSWWRQAKHGRPAPKPPAEDGDGVTLVDEHVLLIRRPAKPPLTTP